MEAPFEEIDEDLSRRLGLGTCRKAALLAPDELLRLRVADSGDRNVGSSDGDRGEGSEFVDEVDE